MPSPIGIGFHFMGVRRQALPNREPNDSLRWVARRSGRLVENGWIRLDGVEMGLRRDGVFRAAVRTRLR